MKMNVLILGMLLLPFCSTAGQADPDRPTTAAVPTPTPLVIDPATGLPVGPKQPRPTPPPPTQIDPATGLPVTSQANPLANGAIEEEGNLNLEAAMNSYQSVISRFDGERPEAANAIFRLGECYRKLGRLEEAKVEYARILREFPDQAELTKLSQKYLFEPMNGQPRFQQRLQAIVRRAPNSEQGEPLTKPSAEPTLDPKTGLLLPAPADLYREALAAKHQLDDLNTLIQAVERDSPGAIPKEAASDARYQELKANYDIFARIENRNQFQRERLEYFRLQLRAWIQKVYLPEMRAQRDFLSDKYDRLSKEYHERIAEANRPHAETKLPTVTSAAKPGPANALPTPPPAPEAPKPTNPF